MPVHAFSFSDLGLLAYDKQFFSIHANQIADISECLVLHAKTVRGGGNGHSEHTPVIV